MKLTKAERAKVKAAFKALRAVVDAGIVDRLDQEQDEKQGDAAEHSYIHTALGELGDIMDESEEP